MGVPQLKSLAWRRRSVLIYPGSRLWRILLPRGVPQSQAEDQKSPWPIEGIFLLQRSHVNFELINGVHTINIAPAIDTDTHIRVGKCFDIRPPFGSIGLSWEPLERIQDQLAEVAAIICSLLKVRNRLVVLVKPFHRIVGIPILVHAILVVEIKQAADRQLSAEIATRHLGLAWLAIPGQKGKRGGWKLAMPL